MISEGKVGQIDDLNSAHAAKSTKKYPTTLWQKQDVYQGMGSEKKSRLSDLFV